MGVGLAGGLGGGISGIRGKGRGDKVVGGELLGLLKKDLNNEIGLFEGRALDLGFRFGL